ncbi:MAG: sulfite exporter TauE/SafE family protein [Deltaproteobacteria bacterium]|nr:sulfite exporter TauE/SafE family protein [Deltaproteobacteria bacterium]
MMELILLYVAVGAVAGILAGLLGIGGGLVIVPMLVFTLTWQAVPREHLMHLALGTSMASIIFTSVSSFMAHHRRGAVQWEVVRRIALGILLGTFLGATLASRLSTNVLKVIFVIFLYYMAGQLFTDRKPKAGRTLPGPWGMFGVGNVIGVVSAFVGIGGGTLSVPFMIYCNLPVHTAIGTSAAIGFPIAMAGTLGYIVNGLGAADLPPFSLGYIYLPALLGIVGCSMLTAPLGVRLAHSLPVDRLKRVFALLLFVVGTKMLWDLMQYWRG